MTDTIYPHPRPQKKNGPAENNQLTTALPADRQKTVEAGLLMFQEIAAERDRLRKDIESLQRNIAQDRVELEALRSLVATLESRVASHQVERDQAIGDRATYESLYISIDALLRAFDVPVTPVVKKLQDAVAAQNEATMRAKEPHG